MTWSVSLVLASGHDSQPVRARIEDHSRILTARLSEEDLAKVLGVVDVEDGHYETTIFRSSIGLSKGLGQVGANVLPHLGEPIIKIWLSNSLQVTLQISSIGLLVQS